MKIIFILLFAFSTLSFACIAQVKPLAVGDMVPDIELNPVVNYKTTHTGMAAFKGRLLILDFWATWCAPCISMFPVCDSLQQEFKNDLQIMPVAEQDEQTVTTFLNNLQRIKNISVASVVDDTILNTLFAHTEIPHYVWIGRDGKVIAITGAGQLTRENISRYLATGAINAPVKKDAVKQINENQPMFAIANKLLEENTARVDTIDNTNILYHSVLTGYIEGFGCETGGSNSRITCKNNSVGGLYRIALGHFDLKKMLLNSTTWSVHDSAALKYSDSANLLVTAEAAAGAWMKDRTFCYELSCPPGLAGKKFDIMLQDLNNYFGALYNIQGSVEKINVKVLALIKTGERLNCESQGIDVKTIYNKFYLKLANQPVSALLNFLSYQMDLLPQLTDETGYNGKIDMELDCDLSDVNAVNKSLAGYGLKLVEKEQEKEMIVIKDKPGPANNTIKQKTALE